MDRAAFWPCGIWRRQLRKLLFSKFLGKARFEGLRLHNIHTHPSHLHYNFIIKNNHTLFILNFIDKEGIQWALSIMYAQNLLVAQHFPPLELFSRNRYRCVCSFQLFFFFVFSSEGLYTIRFSFLLQSPKFVLIYSKCLYSEQASSSTSLQFFAFYMWFAFCCIKHSFWVLPACYLRKTLDFQTM